MGLFFRRDGGEPAIEKGRFRHGQRQQTLCGGNQLVPRTYEKDETARVTNAKRYMNTFSQRPYETWKVIEESIQPYLNKLKVPERIFLENLLNEIYDLFEKER